MQCDIKHVEICMGTNQECCHPVMKPLITHPPQIRKTDTNTTTLSSSGATCCKHAQTDWKGYLFMEEGATEKTGAFVCCVFAQGNPPNGSHHTQGVSSQCSI